MDKELNRRWRKGRRPFDGVTVYLEEHVPLSDLRAALLITVAMLKELWPEAVLYRMHDWHEHDGVVSPSKDTTWREIEEVLASDESLYSARAGDDYVRLGVCPSSREFYLRFYTMFEDDPDAGWPREKVGRYGSFDLTCDPSVAKMVVERLLPLRIPGLQSCSAKKYFDARSNRQTYLPGDRIPGY